MNHFEKTARSLAALRQSWGKIAAALPFGRDRVAPPHAAVRAYVEQQNVEQQDVEHHTKEDGVIHGVLEQSVRAVDEALASSVPAIEAPVSSALSPTKSEKIDEEIGTENEILENDDLENNDEWKAVDDLSFAPSSASSKDIPTAELEAPTEVPAGWDFLFDNAELAQDTAPVLEPVGQFNMSQALGQEVLREEIVVELLPDVLEELEELVPVIDRLLPQMAQGDKKVIGELHRVIHTAKGSVGQIGAKRARAVLHHMETVMEDVEAGMHDPMSKQQELLELFQQVKDLIRPLQTGEWATSNDMQGVDSAQQVQQLPQSVRIATNTIDQMVSDVNENRLSALAMSEAVNGMKHKLKDLEENSQKVFRMVREMELYNEMQIQSRKTQVQESGGEFDPLEFDQFTRAQELSRLIVEGLTDILEDRRDLTKMIADYETVSAQQYRLIQSVQDELHKTRLLPADTINDRLHNEVRTAAKEIGKDIVFEMSGSRVELDRVFLEKIKGPLGHILKNSVVHGIEGTEERRALGKPAQGTISVRFRQSSGRVIIEVADDGYGLRVNKIRQKAIEKGLWDAYAPMNDAQAADMICAPGFSTADGVSELAGRGVGMDAVRKEVLELGGRFEIHSVQTQGMTITIQLPASVASASVLVVEAGGEHWAVPVEMVEHVILVPKGELLGYAQNGVFEHNKIKEWVGTPFKVLDSMNVANTSTVAPQSAPVLLIKERGRMMALEVSKLVQIFEVPLRTSGTIWGNVSGIAGTVILPNGDAIFLLDPFQFTSQTTQRLHQKAGVQKTVHMPLVMVVDDSLTVRKATIRFLTKNGYQNVVAKDGQEALEVLARVRPALVLMDIEMPRMDGFDCTKNIRENPALKDLPIVMITSRTADKHRRHASDVGVNEYLGKPFKENELLKILQKYAPR